jgi:hypothetical protein
MPATTVTEISEAERLARLAPDLVKPFVDELVPLKRGSDAALLAWREDHPGFLETQGYETMVWRLRRGSDGLIRSATAFELRGGTEYPVTAFQIRELEGTWLSIHETRDGIDSELARLSRTPEGSVDVTYGATRLTYARSRDGSIVSNLSRGDYTRREEWAAGTGTSRRVERGLDAAAGAFVDTLAGQVWSERSVEDSQGIGELVWDLQPSGEAFKAVISSVEPIATYLDDGLSSLIQGRELLINLAITERLLGEGRRISPRLALLSFAAARRGE